MINVATDTIIEYLERERDLALSMSAQHIARLQVSISQAERTLRSGVKGELWTKQHAMIDSTAMQEARYWTAKAADLIDQIASIKLILHGSMDGEIESVVRRLQPGQRYFFNLDDGTMLGGVYRGDTGDWYVYDEDATNGANGPDDALKFIHEVLLDDTRGKRIIYGIEAYH